MAVELNIINKSGAWFSYGENRIGQGRDNAREFLKKDPNLLAEIEKKVRAGYNLTNSNKEEPPVAPAPAGKGTGTAKETAAARSGK
jgi:recombination protein RecA